MTGALLKTVDGHFITKWLFDDLKTEMKVKMELSASQN